MNQPITIDCTSGCSAARDVIIGFAPASLLCGLSFPDVLNEDTGGGYQRRFNARHSLDFRRYIQALGSTTIPLTFNLRPRRDNGWQLRSSEGRRAKLMILPEAAPVFAQVDCQHRLGHLADLDLELPFMSFIGLTGREEMEVFNTINSKAKGLSPSLLDLHDAQLASDLAGDRPELFIALYLRNEASSPWYQQLDLGGERISGLSRRASLRTLQKAVKQFLVRAVIAERCNVDTVAKVVLGFWQGVALTLPEQWNQHRKHFLTKGIGVYALMQLAADLCNEIEDVRKLNRRHFCGVLGDFITQFNWTSTGPLKGLGGEAGVTTALSLIRDCRSRARFKAVANA